MNRKIRNTVYHALLTALCMAATMAIPIPTPTGGYLNAGDIIVVLAALLTGPASGALIAGLGSALADLLAGFTMFAPGTLIAKGAAAMMIGMIWNRSKNKRVVTAGIAAIVGELVMVLGYFGYEAVILGFGIGAAIEIPGNLMQGAVGVAGGLALYHALIRIPQIRQYAKQERKKP